ncbi:thioredoxin reductase (NADPH) [Malonomonas rubra DSM 5091]|uniref:Thioredoxin reductase n=1 Tax=Malonomonas rubra DSM 5091 TaxID=1122189 RepID=A0A1M6HA78_MALRU|nr:thioredoxin-disulfide reductase [Malonomonas rubra]SHJ19105.1 thioredoxin reductase (NADPH) [Malonomonas rubra DSM 5091]
MSATDYDVIIIGGGPAGMTAGLYASRAMLKSLMLEKMIMGGQMMTTTLVENWPGYPGGIEGPELMMKFQEHCVEFGLETGYGAVEKIIDNGDHKTLIVDGEEKTCKAVIVATGVIPRKLGLNNEQGLVGRGVSYCATCDGAFFRDLPIAVIGGGDTAAEEALFLTRFASKVYMVHRRDELRATKILRTRIEENEKIEMVWDSVVEELKSDDGGLSAAVLRNVKTDESKEIEIKGMFVAIGVTPTTGFVKDLLDLTEDGYIKSGEDTQTNVPGIYAAGDCRTTVLKQVSTAVGDGAVAAIMAEKHIDDLAHQ